MTGGLLQLAAYGAQDIYLTGNPQITFFTAVYRRHTNFAIQSISQYFNGDALPVLQCSLYYHPITSTILKWSSKIDNFIHKCFMPLCK
jgi:hypothetical protein